MKNNPDQAMLANRKEQLLLDGAAFRVGIVHAKARVAQSLHVDSLLHSAVESAKEFATVKLVSVLGSSDRKIHAVQTLMPFVIGACSALSRKNIFRLAVAVAIASVAAFTLVKRRKN